MSNIVNNPIYDDNFIMTSNNSNIKPDSKPIKDMFESKLEILTLHHTGEQKELIVKAFNFAREKHGDIRRKNKQLYFSHPVSVALIVNEMKADYETICAALLHDVVEDCGVKLEEIEQKFGPVIANMVEGLTKVPKIDEADRETRNTLTINKLSIGMHDDVRIVIIKLADRLDNMKTIDAHDSYETQERIAKQTLDIYVPLAAVFGLYQIKEKLEDLSFKVLKKDEYNQIFDLRKSFLSSNQDLAQALWSLQYQSDKNPESFYRLFQQYDEDTGTYCDLIALQDVNRVLKNCYGIYKKLTKYGYTDISQIKDLITYNIVIKEEQPSVLYGAMYMVNDKYKPIPGDSIIDYVTHPKNNLYRCLITSNTFKDSKENKIRIRVRYLTPSMYYKSIYGLAGYWNYDDMNQVKIMHEELKKMPVYHDLTKIIEEYESEGYTYDEFFKRLNLLIFPNRIYVIVNDEFIQTYEGITLEEFIMSQNNGFIDLNMDYYVNGILINIGDNKKRKKGSQYTVLHNNDSIKIIAKGESVKQTFFGGIMRNRKK